jgi:hypothetical protein
MQPIQHHIHCLETYVEERGARVVRQALPPAVHGGAAKDLITLQANLDPEQQLLALVHEVAHWLAHQDSHAPGARATIYEYEAEAVEALVMARLGLPGPSGDPAEVSPTDGLLRGSLARVLSATRAICQALGVDPALEAQASVDLDAAPRKKVVLEDEEHRVRDLLRQAQAL